jgi:molecular chaperone DnaJ
MPEKDYYAALGIEKNTSSDEIKKAYRKLAIKYHPDKNPGDESAEKKFKEVSEAYSILSDPQKRAHYDQFGTAEAGQGFGFDPGDIFSQFSDLFGGAGFENIFGGGRSRQRRQTQGSSIPVTARISLYEVLTGAKKSISFKRHVSCDPCNGLGYQGENDIEICSYCDGKGEAIKQAGFMTIAMPCNHCHGAGRRITNPCNECNGTAIVARDASVEVNIPIGIRAGIQLRVSGMGNIEPGADIPGDVFVDIEIDNQTHLIVERSSLRATENISYPEAVLGCKKTIQGLNRKYDLDIPAGTQSHSEFSIIGAGLPVDINSQNRDNLIVKVKISVPRNPTQEYKDLAAKLENLKD